MVRFYILILKHYFSIYSVCSNFFHGRSFQSLIPSTQNAVLKGEKLNIKDRGVFSYHGDIYLTTTQKDHRRFNR